MTPDTVDDLWAAEDRIGQLQAAITAIAGGADVGQYLRLTERFCRPTCRWSDPENDTECDGDPECGCPCEHRTSEPDHEAATSSPGTPGEMTDTGSTYQ